MATTFNKLGLSPTREVQVQGFTINNGLLYVFTKLTIFYRGCGLSQPPEREASYLSISNNHIKKYSRHTKV